LGAAYLSGLKSGVYQSIEQLHQLNQSKIEEILPDLTNETVHIGYKGWMEKIQG
jgi:glycerol kinase